MNWVDFFILGILGISVLISLWRGFTHEALSLTGWVLAVWIALTFAHQLGVMLRSHIEPETRNGAGRSSSALSSGL